MNTFTDRWRQLDWDDIRLRINGKTPADVERALAAKQLSRDDMMALLSPPPRTIWSLWPSAPSA
ncbi:thiazole biosynthesis protein ThiH [Klebsiella michiganensis]|nr:thiazole biosynthesis protein ThiH [Klebsiella michiganensis]